MPERVCARWIDLKAYSSLPSSHELKTPLAAINATVTNLLAHDVDWHPATMAEELETIRSAGERLADNINALVDLSACKRMPGNRIKIG